MRFGRPFHGARQTRKIGQKRYIRQAQKQARRPASEKALNMLTNMEGPETPVRRGSPRLLITLLSGALSRLISDGPVGVKRGYIEEKASGRSRSN